MNLRIVLHLYKTDWQRLKWLVIGLWVVTLLLTLPVIFATPFDLHYLTNGGGDGELCRILSERGEYGFRSAGYILHALRLFFANTLLIPLLIGGMIGFHSQTLQLTRPARLRETLAAKALIAFAWLTLPQLLLIALHLFVRGFSFSEIISAIGTQTVTKGSFHLACVFFGMLAGSFWIWLSGLLCGLALLTSILIVSRNHQLSSLLNSIWSQEIHPQARTFHLTLAIALLALAAWSLSRWKATTRSLIAVMIMLATSWFALSSHTITPPFAHLPVDPSIQPQTAVSIKTTPSYRTLGDTTTVRYPLTVRMDRTVTKDHALVYWSCTGDTFLKAEGRIKARVSPSPMPEPPNATGTSAWIPLYFARLAEGKETTIPRSDREEFFTNEFSSREIASLQDTPVTLETEVTGITYRYDVAYQGPITLPAQWIHENMKIEQRPFVGGPRYPMIDLLGITASNGQPQPVAAIDRLKLYLHLPAQGVYYPFTASFSADSHDQAGCRLHRRIYQLDENRSIAATEETDLKNAQLIILAPRNLARNTVRMTSQPTLISYASTNNEDWHYNLNANVDAATFAQETLPFRPDPEIADDHQFGLWLLRASGRSDVRWNSYDLAEFVPRHLDILCRMPSPYYSDYTPQGNALVLACPEQQKESVIEALRIQESVSKANWIPDVLYRRDWIKDAHKDLVEIFLKNPYRSESFLHTIIRLEDPVTYPGLLARVEDGVSTDLYDKLYQLPGIEPALSQAIDRCYQRHRPAAVPLTDFYSITTGDHPFHKLLTPARHGHVEAFGDLLRLWHQIEGQEQALYLARNIAFAIQFPTAVDPENANRIKAYLQDKSASDFQYDPLAHRWVPRETPQ